MTKTDSRREPCEECRGRGAWIGGFALVVCWRCFGTRLEEPEPGDVERAQVAIDRFGRIWAGRTARMLRRERARLAAESRSPIG